MCASNSIRVKHPTPMWTLEYYTRCYLASSAYGTPQTNSKLSAKHIHRLAVGRSSTCISYELYFPLWNLCVLLSPRGFFDGSRASIVNGGIGVQYCSR